MWRNSSLREHTLKGIICHFPTAELTKVKPSAGGDVHVASSCPAGGSAICGGQFGNIYQNPKPTFHLS